MNNTKIKQLALKCGFNESDITKELLDFAWAIVQDGKPVNSHKDYINNLFDDAISALPEKQAGFRFEIFVNDSCKGEPRMHWNFYNGVKRDTFECEVPDTREDLNKRLNNAKGCMKSACYRAMNPDYAKKLA